MVKKVVKSEAEWRAQLTPEQYRITREKGTEPAFTGEYWDCKQNGIYHCICCDAKLFDSNHQYDSGSGWPSFIQPIEPESIETCVDTSHGMHRTEIICRQCNAHLGHVFPDGPEPTGLRYCINSKSLKLK